MNARHWRRWIHRRPSRVAIITNGHDIVKPGNFDPFYDTRIKDHTVEVKRECANEGGDSYRLVEGDVRAADLVSDLVEEAD
ncbi:MULTISPECIES: hypothetical protein [unclassified Haloarcula]|uniref:hypothetical protein n=1 Tax=unclassified Haloarcula TaxID=2624677 RepID=UPI00351A85FC